jgi:hypothetical protein
VTNLFAEYGENVTFENFLKYGKKKSSLNEIELTAVFVGVDSQ